MSSSNFLPSTLRFLFLEFRFCWGYFLKKWQEETSGLEEGGKSHHIVVEKEFLFHTAIRMSVPWEIAVDTGISRETDMHETVMSCCVTADGENAIGQPALIFILKQVLLGNRKLT